LLTRPDLPTENAAEIVGQLAHELRQPLSAMEAIVYYLQLTVVDDARTRAQIEKLRQLIDQSGSILSDAVHYLQAAPARPEPHDLHEALAESAGRLATLDQNLLAFDLADPFPPVLPPRQPAGASRRGDYARPKHPRRAALCHHGAAPRSALARRSVHAV